MLQIREIKNEELDQLYELRNEVLRKPLGMNLYDEDFSKEKEWIKIGAFENEILIGCLMLSEINQNTIKLRQMAVNKYYQAIGIGRQIVKFAENWCLQNNILCIELNARVEAIVFYKKLGFNTVGDYFEEVGIQHLKMMKMLK
jgi:predicted GNAT family N-acyltransferase